MSSFNKDKPFWYDYDSYATLDEAVAEATKQVRRRNDEQVVYKAAAVVAPLESTLPQVTVTAVS